MLPTGRKVVGEVKTGRPLTDLSVSGSCAAMKQSEAASLPDKRPCTEKKRGVLSVGVRAGLDHTTYMKSGRTCERQAGSVCVS